MATAAVQRPINELQNSVSELLRVPKHFMKERPSNTIGFTPFIHDQARKAAELSANFMKVANANPKNPIEKVIEAARDASKSNDPELVRWSLMTFISHHPAARSIKLRIPSLVKRAPETSVPKQRNIPFLAPGPAVSDKPAPPSTDDAELFMNYFREDPNFNEHHEHWHVVYPSGGVPDPNNPDVIVPKDRHGEMFIYMHRQMLARYDTERIAMGIPIVNPLDNYQDTIPEGYKPDDNLVDTDDNTPFGKRSPNQKISDLKGGGLTVGNLEKSRKAIEKAIENDKFSDGTEITSDLLGAVIESSYAAKRYENDYGSLHNEGHVMLAYVNNPNLDDPGVMSQPRVAARDPVFWRWHRHVDNLHNKWQDKLPPNDFSDSPPVKIREGDIILAFKDKLPINNGATQDQEATEFGEKTFGGTNFNADTSSNQYVTHELQTKMKTRPWKMVEDSGATENIEYLFPRDYYYYFRVENTSSSSLDTTFRVYLAPEDLANSRRHWIEMDKFKQTLPPNSKTVVCRDCDMSSVVRQPPQKTEDELDDTAVQVGKEEDASEKYCDCGWPYHLLVPRGRKGGMKFKLLVFITDWSKDEVPTLSRCGSVSFCGAERPSDKYPDGKPMGYPFDRPFKNNSFEETFKGLQNVTIRDVSINWVDNFPEVVAAA